MEVGSGTGLVGLAAAIAGASKVVLTDLPENVTRLQKNIESNSTALEKAGAVVEAKALAWGDLDAVYEVAPQGCDLVLGSGNLVSTIISIFYLFIYFLFLQICMPHTDLCYNIEMFSPLLETLHELCIIRGARVFLATEQRWDHVNEAWAAALARSHMEQIDEFEVETPATLPRRVLCVELQARAEKDKIFTIPVDSKSSRQN